MSEVLWSIVAAVAIQVIGWVYFSGKYAARVDALENRMTSQETDSERWQSESSRLAAIETHIQNLINEMQRVRNKLDDLVTPSKSRRRIED